MSASEENLDDSSAPLIEHLAELRTRLIRSVLAFLAGMILCFAFAEIILDFMLVPIENTLRDLGDPDPQMIFTSPQEYFFTLIR
ncbi:MAG: twin-arginine translocase subunit TatC, partial [Pseudomonadota bacterium]